MKKTTLISLAILAVLPALGQGKAQTYNVLLAGGSEENMIRIWLTPDGRDYVIDSVIPLEVGGTVCANPEGLSNQLVCKARLIASFEVNSGGGNDVVSVARNVSIPATLRGGAGEDLLIGGGGDDKLIGGPGDDKLVGWGGDDRLYGGPGADRLIGGRGEDVCTAGPGEDRLSSCEVRKEGSVTASLTGEGPAPAARASIPRS
jgi:Ca2+-binding RTX toxin-like protein